VLASGICTAVKTLDSSSYDQGFEPSCRHQERENYKRLYLFVSPKKHFYAFEAGLLTSGSTTVVKHWTLDLTIKGLNPAAGTAKEKIIKDYIYLFHQKNIFMHLKLDC
jgi:hypothetical protein